MKQKPARGNPCHMPAALCRLVLLSIFSCSLTIPVFAQWNYNSMIYQFNGTAPGCFNGTPSSINVKGFSTEYVPNGGDETVMAGTMYDTVSGTGRPVFVHFDPYAAHSFPYQFPVIANSGADIAVYDNCNFFDHRVVDIAIGPVQGGTQYYVITMAAREDNTGATTLAPARDQVTILIVDATGAVNASESIWDNSLTGVTWGKSLYPVHTIFKANVNEPATSNFYDILYICGFVTDDQVSNTTTYSPVFPYNIATFISPPHYPFPGFHTKKYAFVMAVDVTGGTVNGVLNCSYYDMATPPGSSPNNPELDFDIAMHMTELSANYPNFPGEIHVTGSVNAVTGSSNGVTSTLVRSATMNMIIDDWDLSFKANGGHFLAPGNGDGYGTNEYGISFVEHTYNSTGWKNDNYIISNKYKGSTSSPGIISPDWVYGTQMGFNVEPDVMTITHTPWYTTPTNYSSIPPLSKRAISDISWAVQTLETVNTGTRGTPNLSQKNFLVAGLHNYAPGGGVPNNDNFIPFLVDMTVQFSIPQGLTGNMTFPETDDLDNNFFDNTVGTGDPAIVRNNYLTMSNVGMQGIAWGPTYAARENTSYDIALNGPRMDFDNTTFAPNGFDFLGLKTMFVNGTNTASSEYIRLGDNTCQFGKGIDFSEEDVSLYNDDCAASSTMVLVRTDVLADITHLNSPYTPASVTPTYYGDCYSWLYKNGTTAVKQAVTKAFTTTIYPNPAKDEIQVQLAGNIVPDAKVKVQLVNMQGQVVANLYNGTAANANAKMHLPDVATGLYIVQVYSNGTIVHQQKLSIQQ